MDEFFTMVGIFLFFLTLVVILGFALAGVRFSSTGAGKHTGFITAIEQEGYFFPNYRVYVKTDNSSSQEDRYCLDRSKTDLAERIKQFSTKRQLVSVSFQGVKGIGLGLCSDVEITDVTQDIPN